MNRFAGQAPVAIVTGAGQGVGRASAEALAQAGWKVALVARSRDQLENVAKAIKHHKGTALACPADVSDPLAIANILETVCNTLGTPVGLVNNAAVVGPVGLMNTLDPVAWSRAVEINLTGAFFVANATAKEMIKQGKGTILNLVSGMGLRVFPRFSAYSVSKAALIHLTRVHAEELSGSGITINALDPGLVETKMHEELRGKSSEEVGSHMLENLQALHRQGSLKPPEIVGKWIADFLSTKALEISGEVGTFSQYETRHNIPLPG